MEFLTIAQFAEEANVTKQTIYRRLERDLGDYCKVIGGRKYIEKSALDLFFVTRNLNQPMAGAERPTEEPAIPAASESDTSMPTPEEAEQTFQYLLEQIQAKDDTLQKQERTIDELRRQIDTMQSHILEQSTAITSILQKQGQLQENFQILLGQQQKQLQQLQAGAGQDKGKPLPPPAKTGGTRETSINPPPFEIIDMTDVGRTDDAAHKKGFWAKIKNFFQ